MKCDRCHSDRIFDVSGKSSDCNNWTYKGGEECDGYTSNLLSACTAVKCREIFQ